MKKKFFYDTIRGLCKQFAGIFETPSEEVEGDIQTGEERNAEEYVPYDTEFMDVSLKMIPISLGNVKDGDILVVEHDDKNISSIYYKDEMEKARRLELLREMNEDWTGD